MEEKVKVRTPILSFYEQEVPVVISDFLNEKVRKLALEIVEFLADHVFKLLSADSKALVLISGMDITVDNSFKKIVSQGWSFVDLEFHLEPDDTNGKFVLIQVRAPNGLKGYISITPVVKDTLILNKEDYEKKYMKWVTAFSIMDEIRELRKSIKQLKEEVEKKIGIKGDT